MLVHNKKMLVFANKIITTKTNRYGRREKNSVDRRRASANLERESKNDAADTQTVVATRTLATGRSKLGRNSNNNNSNNSNNNTNSSSNKKRRENKDDAPRNRVPFTEKPEAPSRYLVS